MPTHPGGLGLWDHHSGCVPGFADSGGLGEPQAQPPVLQGADCPFLSPHGCRLPWSPCSPWGSGRESGSGEGSKAPGWTSTPRSPPHAWLFSAWRCHMPSLLLQPRLTPTANLCFVGLCSLLPLALHKHQLFPQEAFLTLWSVRPTPHAGAES